jgi:hypothetical protein
MRRENTVQRLSNALLGKYRRHANRYAPWLYKRCNQNSPDSFPVSEKDDSKKTLESMVSVMFPRDSRYGIMSGEVKRRTVNSVYYHPGDLKDHCDKT